MKKIIILLAITALMGGCATIPSINLSSQTDQTYQLSKLDPIYISLSENDEAASISKRKFYAVLKPEMIAHGFNIVENKPDAKYILDIVQDKKTEEVQYTQIIPTTSAYGTMGHHHSYGTSTSAIAVPTSEIRTVESISLILFLAEELKNNKKLSVWEGFATANEDDYKNYTKEIVRTLLDYFGKDYDARVSIKM
jgi:hypothetical protein